MENVYLKLTYDPQKKQLWAGDHLLVHVVTDEIMEKFGANEQEIMKEMERKFTEFLKKNNIKLLKYRGQF